MREREGREGGKRDGDREREGGEREGREMGTGRGREREGREGGKRDERERDTDTDCFVCEH